ncbi:FAD-dependent monooxygenase [Sulfitobacter sp. S190]|uniref:FAD-dependent monooxygenase n=1 Tax=Sulfitobacter sp. S190 TaxID=2867022 RepID=UPI0021A649AB|nr:FAD-dependent monooxygenase [Sulfitobacter sp. S190]UWR20921.1 FAD-dependent monooxygenase [Sulfitobacter sp. S190]
MGINNAIVVGGGVGGLAVATALARQGVAVTLLEQSPALTEVGAGLQVSPNGLAVLRALGLEGRLRARGAVEARAVVMRAHNAADRDVARLDLTRLPDGQTYLFAHRADLVGTLAQAAREANVTIELGSEVTTIEPGPLPKLRLRDGAIRRAEVIIAADGIHSRARPVLNGRTEPHFSGQVAWRATVPNSVQHPAEVRVTMGPRRHLVSYPIRGGELVNLVAVEERDTWAPEGWAEADDPKNLRKAFAGFKGTAAQLIAEVRHTSLWGLHLHPVATHWQREGIALLGDAAHPTLPFLAQGANMALEDAWVLAAHLATMDRDEALPAYEKLRRPRVSRVIAAAEANAWRYHLRTGPFRFAAHTGLRMASRLAPGRMLGAFDWLYAVDVTKHPPRL